MDLPYKLIFPDCEDLKDGLDLKLRQLNSQNNDILHLAVQFFDSYIKPSQKSTSDNFADQRELIMIIGTCFFMAAKFLYREEILSINYLANYFFSRVFSM